MTLHVYGKMRDKISSLIMLVVNIKSLHIRLDQLIKNTDTFTKQVHHISCIDISCREHSFTKEDIATIGKCFPCAPTFANQYTELDQRSTVEGVSICTSAPSLSKY